MMNDKKRMLSCQAHQLIYSHIVVSMSIKDWYKVKPIFGTVHYNGVIRIQSNLTSCEIITKIICIYTVKNKGPNTYTCTPHVTDIYSNREL